MDVKELKDLNGEFAQFIGTEKYYAHFMGISVYTDGVKAMADTFEAYWLIDLVVSYQMVKSVRTKPFQIWTITSEDSKAALEMQEDCDQPVVIRKDIPFTTFPDGTLRMYFIDDGTNRVLLLPSEY
jgi:hypothetical protein